MELKNVLNALAPYSAEFKILKGCYLISVVFDEKWKVGQPRHKNIKHQEKNGTHYYWGDMKKVEFDDVYAEIDDVITTNKEIAMTMELLNVKLTELRKLFTEQPYEKLLHLKFVFDKNTPTTKKRGRKPKKTAAKKAEPAAKVEELPTKPLEEEETVTEQAAIAPIVFENDNNGSSSAEMMSSLMEELG